MHAQVIQLRPLAATTKESSFLERPSSLALIFGSFFLVTLPLAALSLFAPGLLKRTHLDLACFIILGNTHFCLTLALYLQSANLRYFSSTAMNRFVYFGVPLLIVAFFAVCRALALAATHPGFGQVVTDVVRSLNFYHWGRQSFGILQMFRGGPRASWRRRCESGFFNLLAAGMIFTFFRGGVFDAASPFLLGGLAVAFLLLGLNLQPVPGGRNLVPGAYLALQTTSALLVIYNTNFYILALAMHYVEYHVIMYPRIFAAPLGGGKADRALGLLRSNRILFYVLLLNLSVVASIFAGTSGRAFPPAPAALLSVFDGLFLFHFFVEAFVWRMGNPYFRASVLPLLKGRVAHG